MLGFGLFELPLVGLYIVIVFYTVFMSVLVNADSLNWATMSTLSMLFLLHIGHVLNVWSLLHNPIHVLVVVLLYLAVGGPWALVKWRFKMSAWKRTALETLANLRAKYLVDHKVSGNDMPAELSDAWVEKRTWYMSEFNTAPQVQDNQKCLITWAIYWPFSLVLTLFNDPVTRFYKWLLIGVLGGHLQSIADKRHAAVQEALKNS